MIFCEVFFAWEHSFQILIPEFALIYSHVMTYILQWNHGVPHVSLIQPVRKCKKYHVYLKTLK